nr:alpha-amylase family glycosyl hydrolase [Kordiimonas marina]
MPFFGGAMALVVAVTLSVSALGADAINTARKGIDPFWNGATVYFMLTDRFLDGDPTNDNAYGNPHDGAVLRNFMGGDIKGITKKINDGYFDALGIDVLWMTPLIEQIHGAWSETWGKSYAFHGYWPKDWTKVDPNYGTEADMAEMIKAAHKHGIRVLADVIMNHTGPETPRDPAWPKDWIRTGPLCDFKSFAGTVSCTVASSLTDMRTDVSTDVPLPPLLIRKWKAEGRLAQETAELDAFFKRTGLPRAPKNYFIKWLTDWVREYGIDGFRVDTAKHVDPEVWLALRGEATKALVDWKARHPQEKIDDKPFFMVGEVFDYGLKGFRHDVPGSRDFDYGDRKVDFFANGFDSLINMAFPTHAHESMEKLFSSYSASLHGGPFDGVGILNYEVSHDDPAPYDKARKHPFNDALKLMLAPGAAQIYYGDELARSLTIPGTIGDATLRSFMNWDDLSQAKTRKLLSHWRKLGQFRHAHMAVGAGVHKMLSAQPYIFSRVLEDGGVHDKVLVALHMPKGAKSLSVYGLFADGTVLKDYYSGARVTVKDGKVALTSGATIVLLGEPKPAH